MEELDDLLEKCKKNRKSFLYDTDFTAEKDVFGKDRLMYLAIWIDSLFWKLLWSSC